MIFRHGSGGRWCRSQSNARLDALAAAMRRKVLPGISLINGMNLPRIV